MARFKKEPGWLRDAQEAKARADEVRRLSELGPVTSLPVDDDGSAERVTADELEATS